MRVRYRCSACGRGSCWPRCDCIGSGIACYRGCWRRMRERSARPAIWTKSPGRRIACRVWGDIDLLDPLGLYVFGALIRR